MTILTVKSLARIMEGNWGNQTCEMRSLSMYASSLVDLDNTLPATQHDLFSSSLQWENCYLSGHLEEGQ